MIAQPAGAETLLYDPVADAVHVLNATALAVWELCDGRHTAAGMTTHLVMHFAATAGHDVSADVQAILARLHQENLIVLPGE